MPPKQPSRAAGRRRRPPEVGSYATSVEQLRELFDHRVERERRVAEALIVIIRHLANMRGVSIQSAIAIVVDFIVMQTSSVRPRRQARARKASS